MELITSTVGYNTEYASSAQVFGRCDLTMIDQLSLVLVEVMNMGQE